MKLMVWCAVFFLLTMNTNKWIQRPAKCLVWRRFLSLIDRERENAFKWRRFNISSKHNRKNQWNENGFYSMDVDSVIHTFQVCVWLMLYARRHLRLIWICFCVFYHLIFHVSSSFNDVKGEPYNNVNNNSSFYEESGSSLSTWIWAHLLYVRNHLSPKRFGKSGGTSENIRIMCNNKQAAERYG